MRLTRLLGQGAAAVAGALFVCGTSPAVIIAEYQAGSPPLSPTTQGWTASQIIEAADPVPELADVVDTSGDPELANAGAGATGWIIRDYLDGAADGQDDRPEYNQEVTPAQFADMQARGWRFTTVYKSDPAVSGQEMRVLSLDQGGGEFLPLDIKINVRSDDSTPNLVLRMPIEDGAGTGTFTSFTTNAPAMDFNTIVIEDRDGDGTFFIKVNGARLFNSTNNSFLFDTTPSNNDVPGDDVIVFGANSTGGDGGGAEYALVRLESLPEPSAALLSGLAVFLGAGIRRRV